MENTFEMACTEVLEILKFLPQNEYERIPKEEIEFLENKKDMRYTFKVNDPNNIKLSKKANSIIIALWEKYFANTEQKEKLYSMLRQNYEKEEKRKQAEYNANDLFKKQKEDNNIILVPIKKERWYTRLFNFIKKVVGR